MKVAVVNECIPAMSDEALNLVRDLEAAALDYAQETFTTEHVFHSGVYLRTMTLPENGMLTGALVKICTTLILSGDATVYLGGEMKRFTGYHVLPASAGRKQVIIAHAETTLTMLFATDATTVEAAEAEFTDETDMLASKLDNNSNIVLVTGE